MTKKVFAVTAILLSFSMFAGAQSIGHGYRLVRVRSGEPPQDLITGFMRDGRVYGRPVDVVQWGAGFLFTDDFAGVVYAVSARSGGPRP